MVAGEIPYELSCLAKVLADFGVLLGLIVVSVDALPHTGYNLPAFCYDSQPNIKPTADSFSRAGCRYFTLF